jgi:hypothetical protein
MADRWPPSQTRHLIVLLDSLASGKLIYDNGVGVLGTEANTTAKAAQNDLLTIAAVADSAGAERPDAGVPVYPWERRCWRRTCIRRLGAYTLWWALDQHLGGLDTYLNAQNIRASRAREAVRVSALRRAGDAARDQSDGDICGDRELALAPTRIVAECRHDAIRARRGWTWYRDRHDWRTTDSPLTITGLSRSTSVTTTDEARSRSPPNSSIGTVVHVGTLGTQADSYNSVTNVSITGGTNGDAFKVSSRVERTISAVS